jgi:lipoprotein signal peptidase
MNRTYRIFLISILLLSTTGCDQVTKRVAKAKLISAGPVSLLNDVIRLEYAENPGAFLSIGEHLPRPILLLVSSILTAGLINSGSHPSTHRVEPAKTRCKASDVSGPSADCGREYRKSH